MNGYISKGTGSPEGVVTAKQGSLWLREDGAGDTTAYVKASGSGNTGWVALSAAVLSALRGVDYLVGTATAELSAEIVVGTSPGGELGGSWGSPTVDSVHSGSAHHDAVTVGSGLDVTGQLVELDLSEVSAGGELGGTLDAPTVDATHSGSAHHDPVTVGTGLDVTGQLVELDLSEVSSGGELGGTMDAPTVDATHSGSSHAGAIATAEGYADTQDAAHVAASDPHTGYLKESNTIDFLVGTATAELGGEIAVGATPGGELGGTWPSPTVHASHSGSTHAATQAAAEATAAAALASEAATRAAADTALAAPDYLVGTATGTLSGEIAVGTSPGGELGGSWGTPTVDASHSGSTHAAAQAAAEATAAAADSAHVAAADPHMGYVLESLLDAKGDLIAASADNTPAKVTVGADDTILMADAAAAAGVKWVASASPTTQAFGDSATTGTDDTFTRGGHKHAMPTFVDVKLWGG